MNVDPIALDGNIADICEKLSELFKENRMSFLNPMIYRDSQGIKLVDIESKCSLHKLHHKTNLNRQVFSAVIALLLTEGVVLVLYFCRKYLTALFKQATKWKCPTCSNDSAIKYNIVVVDSHP